MASEPDQTNIDPAVAPDPAAQPAAEVGAPAPGAPVQPEVESPAPAEPAASPQPQETEEGNAFEKAEQEVAKVFHEVEHLTEEDLRAAIHWIVGALPQPFAQSFYAHHPKFKP